MSAGEPGSIWSERLGCWIMDTEFIPAGPAHTAVRSVVRSVRRPSLSEAEYIAAGEKLVDQIMFWRDVPIIGSLIAAGLAGRLDQVTDALDINT